MVLAELGNRLSSALAKLSTTDNVNEEVIAEMLKEIGNALIASDVNVQLVMTLRRNIRARANLQVREASLENPPSLPSH